jgi:tetraacyldisaccharide 4'-kinase
MSGRGESWLNRVWYGDSGWSLILMPLSWLYAAITGLRRCFYKTGVWRIHSAGVPVIVVGNITTGGTGKTPLTVWLVRALKERGFSPGIVSRGYRGDVGSIPVEATANSDPAVVGDEPVLLAKRCDCPIFVHPDRVAAARMLREKGVNVIIADDGLQHYRLARDVEIVVVDGDRLWGNQRLLPAGPLRESVSRLQSVSHIFVQGADKAPSVPGISNDMSVTEFSLRPIEVGRLDGAESVPLNEFRGKRVHAVAAIGNPDRFFDSLEEFGMDVVRHAFPDHAPLTEADLAFEDTLDVLMTEKDAVKCSWPVKGNYWYVPVEAVISGSKETPIMNQIEESISKYADSDHV